MKLVLSRLALAELDEILRYLSERSPLGATHRMSKPACGTPSSISGVFLKLPNVLSDVLTSGAFPLARYPYVVYYEIGQDEVTVLRILHGARRGPWDEEGS
jgi:toxin ParE1/3/4